MRFFTTCILFVAITAGELAAADPIFNSPDVSLRYSSLKDFAERIADPKSVERLQLTYFLQFLEDDDLPAKMRLPKAGVVIQCVAGNTAFMDAGLKPYDVVYAVNGRHIADPAALAAALQTLKVGDVCRFDVRRATIDYQKPWATWRTARVSAKVSSRADNVRAAMPKRVDEVEGITYYVHRDQHSGAPSTQLTTCILQRGEATPRLFLRFWFDNASAPAPPYVMRVDEQRLEFSPDKQLPQLTAKHKDYLHYGFRDQELVSQEQLHEACQLRDAKLLVVRINDRLTSYDRLVLPVEQERLAAALDLFQLLGGRLTD